MFQITSLILCYLFYPQSRSLLPQCILIRSLYQGRRHLAQVVNHSSPDQPGHFQQNMAGGGVTLSAWGLGVIGGVIKEKNLK